MKISKIEIQKNNKSRANVYVDDTFACGLSLETILKNRLKENQEISMQELENCRISSEYETALNKVVNLLSKSQKTEKEISDYLTKKGFEGEIISKVLKKLKEYKFVDDNLYAQNYVKYKSKNNGSRKLEYDLLQKGINNNVAKENIGKFCDDEKNILSVAEKYLKNKPRDLKTKQKAFRFLASKGFLTDTILSCLDKFFKGDKYDESWD